MVLASASLLIPQNALPYSKCMKYLDLFHGFLQDVSSNRVNNVYILPVEGSSNVRTVIFSVPMAYLNLINHNTSLHQVVTRSMVVVVSTAWRRYRASLLLVTTAPSNGRPLQPVSQSACSMR